MRDPQLPMHTGLQIAGSETLVQHYMNCSELYVLMMNRKQNTFLAKTGGTTYISSKLILDLRACQKPKFILYVFTVNVRCALARLERPLISTHPLQGGTLAWGPALWSLVQTEGPGAAERQSLPGGTAY